MPLDHYVPQCHLRQFVAPELGHMMFTFSKRLGKRFQARPADVCRIQDGNSLPYLENVRSVEDFLKTVEPKYDACVRRIRDQHLDPENVYVVAALLAYIMTCSPTATRAQPRLAQDWLKHQVSILDEAGELPKAPAVLGGKSATQLLQEGELSLWTDPEYPRAIAASSIEKVIGQLGNSIWDIMTTGGADDHFLTSDFPAAIDDSLSPNAVIVRVLPLTPNLAVRIIPDRNASRDYTFSGLRWRRRTLTRGQVMAVNRCIVRSAEDHVFSSVNSEWLPRFVSKYRTCRVDVCTSGNAAQGPYAYRIVAG